MIPRVWRGNFGLESSRSGRPSSSMTKGNFVTMWKMLETNRHVTYHQIEVSSGINAPAVLATLRDHLQIRKFYTLLIPYNLIDDQMACRVSCCLEKWEISLHEQNCDRWWNLADTIMTSWPRLRTKCGCSKSYINEKYLLAAFRGMSVWKEYYMMFSCWLFSSI